MKIRTRSPDLFLATMAIGCMAGGFLLPFAITRYGSRSARMAVEIAGDPDRFDDADRQQAAVESLLTRVDLYFSMEAFACMFFGLAAGVSLFAVAHLLNKGRYDD